MSLERVAPIYPPFAGGNFRLAMGVQPIEDYAWFDLGQNLSLTLAAKRTLLEARHADVFCALPVADDAAAELLQLLAEHLPRHHSPTFRVEGHRLRNAATGEVWDTDRPPVHPLDLAGRLVAEDLCLLLPQGNRAILVGATLCSPARWVLAEKIGQPARVIHAPVPGFAEALGEPVDQFLAALKADRLFCRFNWGIADDPTPFQPVARAAALDVTPATAGEKLWLRVERQVLRRLPKSSAIVFTIRTYITRLDQTIGTSADARDLAVAIRTMPQAMQDYKRITPYAEAMLGWLDARA